MASLATRFYVSGMKCEGCASTVKQALVDAAGVDSAEVDLAEGEENRRIARYVSE